MVAEITFWYCQSLQEKKIWFWLCRKWQRVKWTQKTICNIFCLHQHAGKKDSFLKSKTVIILICQADKSYCFNSMTCSNKGKVIPARTWQREHKEDRCFQVPCLTLCTLIDLSIYCKYKNMSLNVCVSGEEKQSYWKNANQTMTFWYFYRKSALLGSPQRKLQNSWLVSYM